MGVSKMRRLLIGRWFVLAVSAHITRRTWKYYDLICKVFCSSSLPLDCYFGEGAFIHALVSTLNRKKPWSLDFAAVAHIDRVFSPRVASGSGHRVTVTIDVGKECLCSDESG
mmetsp:Transcript_12789/g.29407  ORF Transcript_12789/g.29407 Transcript_12789/m.29407 type:complete len:112 (-) Transcript_12789:177-512(-)